MTLRRSECPDVRPFQDTCFIDQTPPATLQDRDEAVNQNLAQRYDALGQLFTEAEKCLKALKPIRSVWLSYNPDASDSAWDLLGMTWFRGQWRLCYAQDDCIKNQPHNVQPIVECPREVRLGAVPIVRQLYEEIIRSKEDHIPEVDDAIAILTHVIQEMK